MEHLFFYGFVFLSGIWYPLFFGYLQFCLTLPFWQSRNHLQQGLIAAALLFAFLVLFIAWILFYRIIHSYYIASHAIIGWVCALFAICGLLFGLNALAHINRKIHQRNKKSGR